MKYSVGDRVKIVSHGHAIWKINEDGLKQMIDLQPQLVGQLATVIECTEVQPGYEQYSLQFDNYGKISWFGLKQLVLIEKMHS